MPLAPDRSGGDPPPPSPDLLKELRELAAATKESPVAAAVRMGPSEPNFNPTAVLDTSRVSDIPAAVRAPEALPPNIFSLAAMRQPESEEQTRPKTAWDSLNADPSKRTAHRNPAVRSWSPDRAVTLAQAKIDRAQADLLDGRDQPSGIELMQAGSMNLMDELGMKAGALTTVPEVEAATEGQRLNETPSVKADILTQLREEAMAKGIRGKGVQAYIHERTGQPGTEDYMKQDELTSEEDVADQQERRQRTQNKALNLGGSRQRTEALTAEEYADLSPRRKAAVDLNTMLVTAIREDLKGKQSSTKGGKEYDAAVADMFGEKGAAEATFAPTTMRVLQDIGFKADGAQLDDVLKLKIGLTAEDIADLGDEGRGGPDASLLTPEKRRDDLTEALVATFAKQRKDPQRGAALLETQRDVLNTRENLDFGTPANNQFVEQVYEFLAKPENKGKMQETMALAKTTLSDEHWPIFLAFLDARSREALQYDRPLGMDGEADYMRPKRFRSRLGL